MCGADGTNGRHCRTIHNLQRNFMTIPALAWKELYRSAVCVIVYPHGAHWRSPIQMTPAIGCVQARAKRNTIMKKYARKEQLQNDGHAAPLSSVKCRKIIFAPWKSLCLTPFLYFSNNSDNHNNDGKVECNIPVAVPSAHIDSS